MEKEFITKNLKETKKLGEMLAAELRGGEIICLSGELGAGKTTFSQGILEGLGAKGPYTSPTFVVMKHYEIKTPKNGNIRNAYHVDAYRIGSDDMLNLGWEEIISNKENVIIVEWAERLENIIPKCALRIDFSWEGENERKINFKS
ncbi:MAG: tRNA (adenosine(37)-N6)-threonylcarbamoyltransferase complex ATPase subunit type 1 TsaE [Candidatus Moranbacteria bacterium]|nr:tRNA (adenosine(37)-N6)-threonylcarbamoyltransferase complex ATPase subunit type 1 TsaE [Candidatus Moranbacteria bacterium]